MTGTRDNYAIYSTYSGVGPGTINVDIPFNLDEAEALETLGVMSPIGSFTIWYAALTGVLLWLASVAWRLVRQLVRLSPHP